ncbi:MAG: aminotransferase class I/II-fold pyridoxal phosphate-dependent enzyme [Lachnospiraceae bacterium]|nr:aminotransferase class I/II-fold pyridoxal phosphate-dependent enzyme [Lachnospiraceae bacterium]
MKTLYELLYEYKETDYYPFHMPGHKRKSVDGNCEVLEEVHQIDITEIDGFDNLHHAEGVLKMAQERVARLYGAEESFFLINGSTGGLLSAISAVCECNKKVLICRNSHKAVYNALAVNKVCAEYVWPSYIEERDLIGKIEPYEIAKILEKNKDINAVVVTSPTYDGVVSDVKQIAEIVHHYNIPLIVDEAHGAHFAFDDRFPKSAVSEGADIVINSTHKTLPAMTQTALLHVQGNLVNRSRLKNYLQIYQTSSPSYVLMASIDSCMQMLEKEGSRFFDRLFILRREIDDFSKGLKCLQIVSTEIAEPGKIIVSTKNTNLSGQELYEILLNKYHIQMEMAGFNYVVGILTAMDTEEGVCRLLTALEAIDEELDVRKGIGEATKEAKDNQSKMEFYRVENAIAQTYHEAMNQKSEWIELGGAAGRAAGAMIVLYPPGIPVLVPGEIIEEEIIQQLEIALTKKMNVLGLSQDENKICVLCE